MILFNSVKLERKIMRWKLISVLSILGILSTFLVGAVDIERLIQQDVKTYFETGKTGGVLQRIYRELDVKSLIQGSDSSKQWPQPKIDLFCITCAAVVNEFLSANSSEEVANRTIDLCLELNLGNQVVCEGSIYGNEDALLYIHANSPNLTGNDICGVVFQSQGCVSNNPDRIWEVTLPDVPKPPIDEPPYPDPSSVPTLKVLHFADTHYDPDYLPYSNANCEEIYYCCRPESGPVQQPLDAAGFWGDYRNCDIPKWTLEALYQHINETHSDIDMIIWTGDLIPHNAWNTSRESNIEILHEMADLILKYFPGIPVFPAVGNHEADPANLFSQPYVIDPEFEMSWLYDELAAVWGVWLPADTATSIAYASFYSAEVRPGLRILSINSNFCYTANWWLILDSVDIAEELFRMAQELQKAEDSGEFVYIIHHHPVGYGDCDAVWSHQYNKIIARYENTISGLFYGHTHNDEFELFFDPDDLDRVIEIAYIAQSQTTYSYLNPGYKIYTIEGDFAGSRYRVLDHDNWILALDTANIRNYTEITHLYSAKSDYGLQDLSPQSWLDLVYQMNEPTNMELFMNFHTNFVKGATPSLNCDDGCKKNLLCSLIRSDTSNTSCAKLGYN